MSYIHFGLPILSQTASRALNVSTLKIQEALLTETGERYWLEDLNDVLARWLESCVEKLAEVRVAA